MIGYILERLALLVVQQRHAGRPLPGTPQQQQVGPAVIIVVRAHRVEGINLLGKPERLGSVFKRPVAAVDEK